MEYFCLKLPSKHDYSEVSEDVLGGVAVPSASLTFPIANITAVHKTRAGRVDVAHELEKHFDERVHWGCVSFVGVYVLT